MFSLDEHFNAFIEDEVASGRYRSASDVVRVALRLLEEREARLDALCEALIVGENSGVATPFDFDAFVIAYARWRTSRVVSRYVLSPAAQGDLEPIWHYTCERWNIDQDEQYVRLIQHAVELIAGNPLIRKSCETFVPAIAGILRDLIRSTTVLGLVGSGRRGSHSP